MNKAEASLFLQVTYGVGGIYNEFCRILFVHFSHSFYTRP